MEQVNPMSFRNRTGLQRSPIDASQMVSMPPGFVPDMLADDHSADRMRAGYIDDGDTLGSVPAPATLKGVVNAGVQALSGNRMQALMDKLGERLAFERAGTRLYQAALRKCEIAAGSGGVECPIEALREIERDEAAHALLLQEAIEKLGGDATCQTPCADSAGVEGMGLMQVLAEPRTTVAQTLHALLTAELVDNDGWALLIELMEQAGQPELATRFRAAAQQEERHLIEMRRWHREAVMREGDLLASAA